LTKEKKRRNAMQRNRGAGNRKRMWAAPVICICLAIGLALMWPCQASAQQKAGPAKTLKIGAILAVSGWYAAFDAMEAKHLQAVADIINDKGGISVKGEKYKVELVIEDGKSTIDGFGAAATRLSYDDKVKFVIGPSAFFGLASTPVFEEAKVLHVASWNTFQPGEMDANTPYAFLGMNSTLGILPGSIKAMKKEFPNVKKLVVTTADDGAPPYMMPKVKKILAADGMSVIDTILFPNEMEDFSPIAAKANSYKDADGFMNLLSSPVGVASIIKGVRALGNNKPYICVQTVPADEILSICGKAAGNNVMTSGIAPLAKGNPALINEVFTRAGGKPPMFLLNATGFWTLYKIIEAADSLDPAVVKAKWESMDKVETLFGPGLMGGKESYGIKHAVTHPVPYNMLMKGEVVVGGYIPASPLP
jgi:branched-chain amino acid transport system substrate-binding protein